MQPALPAEALVLVTILPDPRDQEIARVMDWYRMPYRRAPKTIDMEYQAFYQTVRFGAEKWTIHYVAPMLGHELTTRAEPLRDAPDHPRVGWTGLYLPENTLREQPESALSKFMLAVENLGGAQDEPTVLEKR